VPTSDKGGWKKGVRSGPKRLAQKSLQRLGQKHLRQLMNALRGGGGGGEREKEGDGSNRYLSLHSTYYATEKVGDQTRENPSNNIKNGGL